MNERIKLLAEQAEWRFADKATGEFSEYDKRLEKFAELIIQECLLSLEPNLYESDIEYRVDQAFYKKCERMILKHFGVNN